MEEPQGKFGHIWQPADDTTDALVSVTRRERQALAQLLARIIGLADYGAFELSGDERAAVRHVAEQVAA